MSFIHLSSKHLTEPLVSAVDGICGSVFFKIVVTVWMLRSLLHRLFLCRVQRRRPNRLAVSGGACTQRDDTLCLAFSSTRFAAPAAQHHRRYGVAPVSRSAACCADARCCTSDRTGLPTSEHRMPRACHRGRALRGRNLSYFEIVLKNTYRVSSNRWSNKAWPIWIDIMYFG